MLLALRRLPGWMRAGWASPELGCLLCKLVGYGSFESPACLSVTMQVERLEKQISGLQLQLRQQQAQTSAQNSPAAGSPVQGAAGQAGSEEGSEAGSEAGSDGAAASAAAAAAAAVAEERAAAAERLAAELRRQLVEQRDRADAFEALLQQQATAAAAAAAVAVQAGVGGAAGAAGCGAEEAAAAGAVGMEAAQTPGAAGATPSKPGSTPGGAAAAVSAAPSPLFPGFAPAGTPLAGGLPSAAFLAASPVLSASRAVADWMADADAAEAATPAGQPLPLLQLLPGGAEIVCERESHMGAEELRALKVGGTRGLEPACGWARPWVRAMECGRSCGATALALLGGTCCMPMHLRAPVWPWGCRTRWSGPWRQQQRAMTARRPRRLGRWVGACMGECGWVHVILLKGNLQP